MKVALALYQPDIPQNTGAILRLGACLDVDVHLIEPAGFRLDDKGIARAGLDYLEHARLVRHADWAAFKAWVAAGKRRLIVLSTKASTAYTAFNYHQSDILLLGRESAGLPDAVHRVADARLNIPIDPKTRSLNLAVSAAMVVGEALRQTGGFPAPQARQQ